MKNLFRRLSRKLRLGSGTGTEPPADDATMGGATRFTHLAASATQVHDEGLQEFLADRINTLHTLAAEPEQWVLPTVDFLDELKALEDYPAGDMAILAELAAGIQALLAEAGAELLTPPQWDPTLQRAIKVNYVLPCPATPVVVNTFATGVKLGGRLLRKQEVELNMPSSSSSYH